MPHLIQLSVLRYIEHECPKAQFYFEESIKLLNPYPLRCKQWEWLTTFPTYGRLVKLGFIPSSQISCLGGLNILQILHINGKGLFAFARAQSGDASAQHEDATLLLE